MIETLAQAADSKRDLIGSAARLWVILAVIGITILVMTGVVLYRHHRRTRVLLDKPRKTRPIADAWAEAGRRARPLPREDDEEPEA